MNTALWKQFEGHCLENTYHLTRILGAGGFGGVFFADHVVENRFVRHVAVKLIPSDPDQIHLQLNELVAATTLQHPHLLPCFHAGSIVFGDTKLLYLVMELAEDTLQSRLKKELLSQAEAYSLACQLASALVCIHEKRFVHRDIKPANVLRVGDTWKLSDFGTVRRAEGATTSRTEMITGTTLYMPPESFDGVVSPAWDVWSIGILLLQSLSSKRPFEGTTDQQLTWEIMRNEPTIPVDLPEPFSEIIRGCLTKDFRTRWTAQRIAQILDAHGRHTSEERMGQGVAPSDLPKFQAHESAAGSRQQPEGDVATRIATASSVQQTGDGARRDDLQIRSGAERASEAGVWSGRLILKEPHRWVLEILLTESHHRIELSLVDGYLLKTRVGLDGKTVAERIALGRLTHQFMFPVSDGAKRYEVKASFKLALITFDLKSCTLVVGNQLLCSEP